VGMKYQISVVAGSVVAGSVKSHHTINSVNAKKKNREDLSW